jgi:hypothetical protein
VLILSAVMAYVDGFWLTSLQGAVGAIERSQGPFQTWLRSSTLAVPIVVLAVLAAVALVRRRFGGVLNRPSMVVAAILLIASAGTVAGIGQAVTSSVTDYRLQARQIEVMNATHAPPVVARDQGQQAVAGQQGQVHHVANGCSMVCSEKTATLRVHVRAITYVSAVMLATNLVLVVWVVAMLGGQLAATTRRVGSPIAQ